MSAPSNYLAWAILATVFCFLPAGIVAIVYASQVNSKWNAGDIQGAQSSSNNAKIWAIVSAAIGAVLVVGVIILIAVGAFVTAKISNQIPNVNFSPAVFSSGVGGFNSP